MYQSGLFMNTSSTFNFRLGFDGGGTKTRAVVIDADCRILGAGESGASNPYAVGMMGAIDNIEAAAEAALAQAKLKRADISGWGLGLGGVCSPTESADVEAALRQRVGAGPTLVAVEDVVAAWSGAFGGEVGETPRALCIAGTGSNCWGKNARGETANADGAGPLLGDRGSGFWIGEQALRHASRAADGVVPDDDLAAAVLAHFEAEDIKALIRVVYAPDFQRSRIASLVPVVLRYAEEEAALEILSNAGRELALTSLAVLRKLSDDEGTRGEVALLGGVLAHAEPVKAAFLHILHRGARGTELVEARYEPAVGAALLA
jgi:N-acetylglucosamine kinase-like BadF-type ATPase